MAGGRKRRLVKYEEDSDFEEEKTTKKSKTTDDEEDQDMQVISESSFRPSKMTIPRPAHGPFPDALSADSLEFLASLAENNDRDFMHVKAKEWERTRKDFTDFVGLLAKEIHQVDPSVRLEQPKHAVYRQHRDLRFTNDKRPYKTNLSASFSRSGPWSPELFRRWDLAAWEDDAREHTAKHDPTRQSPARGPLDRGRPGGLWTDGHSDLERRGQAQGGSEKRSKRSSRDRALAL